MRDVVKTFIIACFITCLTFVTLAAQPTPSPDKEEKTKPNPTEAEKRLNEFLQSERPDTSNPAQEQVIPEPPLIGMVDDTTKQHYQQALLAYYQYRVSGYEHRKAVFAWQFYSSIIIFFVVIFLVLSGLYLSWVQFRMSMYRQPAMNPPHKEVKKVKVEKSVAADSDTQGTVVETKAENEVTKLKASMEGIEVSSPVLGVIILFISLLFFFLYLKVVYPINNAF